MKFNYQKRMEIYKDLITVLEGAGYQIKSFPANEAGDAIGVILPCLIPAEVLLIYRRENGWFIRAPGIHIYRVSNPESIADVTVAFLSYTKETSELPNNADHFLQKHSLLSLSLQEWYKMEQSQQLTLWRKKGWEELNSNDENLIWDTFEKRIDINGANEPAPSRTWDISVAFGLDEIAFQDLESELTLKALDALRQCTRPGNRLYALDWNHPCYFFNPHNDITDSFRDSWAVPILPNGNNYYFVDHDFHFGILGRYNNRTICVFGKDLVVAIERNKPKIFEKLIRIDGKGIGEFEDFSG